MALAALLEEAGIAPADRRIDLRDPIAACGIPAIAGVLPWLQDVRLAAFAVRAIERVGTDGEPTAANKALRGTNARARECDRTRRLGAPAAEGRRETGAREEGFPARPDPVARAAAVRRSEAPLTALGVASRRVAPGGAANDDSMPASASAGR